MCGIAGALITDKSTQNIDLGNLLPEMIKNLEHRGPNSKDFIISSNIGLGHTRLAVLDLTEAGNQPMNTPDNDISLVFNGEIYNFKELKNNLKKNGFKFKSSSDTEVILYGYRFWGKDLFHKLQGMFAIAIWDKRKEELILARDQIGKKPLFYSWNNGNLLFSSEIKGILAFNQFNRQPNLEAIHHYLTFQYIPAPLSAFEGINKVPQASFITISNNGEIRQNKYWSLKAPTGQKKRNLKDLQEELLIKLEDATKLRMISDVPIGAFLSGGVDSSAIVALMAKLSDKKIKTFNIGFNEEDYDERNYAREVAKRYDTDHTEMVVTPKALDIIDKIVWHYNEPFADPSAIATFYVSEIAKKDVTVVLNGDGGDENFLGYPRYERCLTYQKLGRIPPLIKKINSKIGRKIPENLNKYKLSRVLRNLLINLGTKNSTLYAPSIIYFSDQDKDFAYDEKMLQFLNSSSIDTLDQYFNQSSNLLEGAAWTDIHTYLPDDLLVKVDIASMAFGLEARSPFLDHRLMEWAANIHPSQKMFNSMPKYLLKKAMEPYLSKNILYRPKMGFGVPIDYWLRNELKDFAYDTLLSDKAKNRKLINPKYIENLLEEHIYKNRPHHTRIWALLMLEMWFKVWID
tara:strand:- start:28890 stop:30776 length:1887 start_codon:yes stop_codon:yes gene_type:complete